MALFLANASLVSLPAIRSSVAAVFSSSKKVYFVTRSHDIVLPSCCASTNEKESKLNFLDVMRCFLHYLDMFKQFTKSDALFLLLEM